MNDGWELNHVGMVVRSKNKILHYLQSKGVGVSVGPQPLLPYIEGSTTVQLYRTLYGDSVSSTSSSSIPGAHTFYDGESQIGSCQLECIQPGPGSFISDYLNTKGEGINHLCFNVPDVEKVTQMLMEQGCDLVFSAVTGGQTVENYLDTREHGDVILSFRPPAAEWENAWKENNVSYPLVNDWAFMGVGVAVENLDETLEYYRYLGFTEVEPERVVDNNADSTCTVNDEVIDAPVRLRTCSMRVGSIYYDFLEPVTGENVCAEAFAQRGEGIFSLDFAVSDLDAETARLTGNGLDVALAIESTDGNKCAYFDTREVGNTLVKLTQMS
ncbi:MAG: VOC family protein [Pseudomonadales bacterium]|jgi:hypothetical protein|nr:VOC family protein [Pseudomonadales bacterium]MDP6472177.1 VOC family protein [Pseudomonadales bacterium]MDP6826571.1 VOC family protein [Pseudomonadales bacterium]MDP6970158.1 VOC family protein [Pseudomonadales bacterium]|tara:strand:- start:1893 stop:2873 length:981 start_codon:yes stop_codon:yes gene_type:complete